MDRNTAINPQNGTEPKIRKEEKTDFNIMNEQ